MRIQTFNNGKGLIHGTDNKRIGCDIAGTLKIGTAEVEISAEEDFFTCTEIHCADVFTHAPFCDHLSCNFACTLNVIACTS